MQKTTESISKERANIVLTYPGLSEAQQAQTLALVIYALGDVLPPPGQTLDGFLESMGRSYGTGALISFRYLKRYVSVEQATAYVNGDQYLNDLPGLLKRIFKAD